MNPTSMRAMPATGRGREPFPPVYCIGGVPGEEPLGAPPHDRSFRCYRISSYGSGPNSPFLGARRCGGPCTIAPIATKRIGAIRAIINRILYVIGPPGPTAEILPSPAILAKLGHWLV